MIEIAAVILAAGQATRFGAGPHDTKLVALLAGLPLIRHVAEAASHSKAHPIVVVTGHAREKVETALSGLDLHFLHNSDPAAGLSHSLKLGLSDLSDALAGAIILLGDMPYVTPALIDRLIEAFAAAPSGTIAVVPVYAGQRGNPVLLSKDIFAAVEEIEGDRGARSLLDRQAQGVVEVEIDDAAVTFDVDTRAMLESAKDSPAKA